MKILFFIRDFEGGPAKNLSLLSNRLYKKHDVLIIQIQQKPLAFDNDLNEHIKRVILNKKKISIFSIIKIFKIIFQFNPDIIHSFDFLSNVMSFLILIFYRKIIFVTSVRGLETGFNGWRRHVQSLIFRRAQKIHCVSNAVREKIYSYFPAVKDKVQFIRNGIDVNKFQFKKINNIDKDLLIIGCISNYYDEVKGQTFLLKALEILSHENDINFLAYFIGDGPLKKKCEILSNKLNLKSKVFFNGFKKDIRSELKKINVLVLPSLSESFGLILLEAAASGVFIMGSKVGGIPEIIKEGETGYLFKAGDSNEIAEKIKYLINDANNNQIIKNAYTNVLKNYNIYEITKEFENMYASSLKR